MLLEENQAPACGKTEQLQQGTILYRGSRDAYDGSWYSLSEEVGKRYEGRGRIVRKYQTTKTLTLSKIMESQTREYYSSYSMKFRGIYDAYVSFSKHGPVPANAEIPPPIYADAPDTAEKLRDILKELNSDSGEIDGWIIPNGYYWDRQGNPEFHPEVMLFEPSDCLTGATPLTNKCVIL
jgi:hypothetical protein